MRFILMVSSGQESAYSSSSHNFFGALSLGSGLTLSTILTWTTVISLFLTRSVGTLEDESQFSLRRHPPYYNAELYKVLRQHYKYQDFLWAGSGEGPEISSENQDGMAWEDDDSPTSGQGRIKVTRTMVLYKTVLSTIYPVGLTPVVIEPSRPSSTPTIEMTIQIDPSLTTFSNLIESDFISPTASFPFSSSTALVQVHPTATVPSITESTTEPETGSGGVEETSESINDRLSASATDPRYWITTSIRKKRSDKYHPNDLAFHDILQKRLAQIYAAAFKRQLLKSLRLMGQHNSSALASRNRRSNPPPLEKFKNTDYEEDAETNPLYFFLRNQSPVARTSMNVSVSMINVSWSSDPQIDLKYIVYAESTPVQGFVAVKELQVISKKEMENKLGYEIIDTQALVQPPERSEMGVVASTTPWLIALMALVCLMILILALTLFMAWKWRHNRLRDRQEQFPTISDEMVHPTPTNDQGREGRSVAATEKDKVRRSPSSAVFRVEQENGAGGPHLPHQPPQPRPHPNTAPGSPDEKSSSTSMLIAPSEGSSYNSHSPKRRLQPKASGVARKVNRQRRTRRRKTQAGFTDEDGTSPRHRRLPEITSSVDNLPHEYDNPDFSFTGDICRNTDKISFGNLEIYTDTPSRPASAQLKQILSRPSSHEGKKSQAINHPHENIFFGENQTTTAHEQDRELSEKSFDGSGSGEDVDKKDAQVQTPTRLKRRQSPRVRTSPKHKSSRGNKASKMSLISTESEEAVDFHNLPFSSQEINPIGRIRKRFHQFLDDAFNVMAVGRKDGPGKREAPQSAKVTVSHQMKTKAPGRPWTSHVIREESVRKIRPKSSTVIGPPKPAWTEERRCQSAKSKGSIIEEEVHPGDGGGSREELNDIVFTPAVDRREDSPRMVSSKSSSTVRTECHQGSFSEASHSYVFPKYPTYPEVETCLDQDRNMAGQSHGSRSLHPLDPAVPLIEAIKDEMRRFEKVKVSSTNTNPSKKS